MLEKMKLIAVVFVGAGISALLTWGFINWIPSVSILAGSVAGGYITWLKTKDLV